jgi:4-amino-4-deoxy-L-arabinose transferase-like glycosyltransferase
MEISTSSPKSATRLLLWQGFVVLVFWGFVVGLHADNDGLWFQGDAPRHAASGLFYWDLLTSFTLHPVDFALSYYARYPVITPIIYPPLFHILEGAAFRFFGPSPYVAKALVLTFLLLAGFYLMAWLRRWVGNSAGWAAPLLFLMPGIILFSHAVLLNVPAMAMSLAALYHARCWLEKRKTRQLKLMFIFAALSCLTYYLASVVIFIILVWIAADGMFVFLLRRKTLPITLSLLLVAFLCVLAAFHWTPIQLSWMIPDWKSLASLTQWTHYWPVMLQQFGLGILIAALLSVLGGIFQMRWHPEIRFMIVWVIATYAYFSVMPAKDPRYIMLLAPALVVLTAIGGTILAEYCARRGSWNKVTFWVGSLLLIVLLYGWPALRQQVPRVDGIREVAEFLKERAPDEPVFYDGYLGGVLGFFVCAGDRDYHQRLVLADKTLYTGTWWQMDSNIKSPGDALEFLKRRAGCRWIAIERDPQSEHFQPQLLLRSIVTGPEFELVRSFPISGLYKSRVDIYRFLKTVDSGTNLDLTFPLLGGVTFRNIQPIVR